MQQDLLLAEELALVAVNEDTGRHALGLRTNLNACLAGLLVAELVLNGHARPGDGEETLVLGGGSPGSPTLAAAGRVLVEKGPKIKGVLSHMDRGLTEDLGRGTWDAAISGPWRRECSEQRKAHSVGATTWLTGTGGSRSCPG